MVHNHPTKFVQLDLSLLRGRYVVREWNQKSRIVNLAALADAISESDLIFGWFASWHTLLPMILARWFHRPSILIVGGYDTANLPEINYGSQRGGFKTWVARLTMREATRVIAFSEYSCNEAIRNAQIVPSKLHTICLGVPSYLYESGSKENLVITVGNVDRGNLQRKGLELFVRAGSLCPVKKFVVLGAWRDDAIEKLRALAAPNVQFTGWVSDEELRGYFARARVYVQASRHEGFGLAVAEAMLCECVPVVSRAGSLPEVVGDAGVYVESFEPGAVAEGVDRAFDLAAMLGPRARARIAQEFPLEKRRAKLFELIEGLLSNVN